MSKRRAAGSKGVPSANGSAKPGDLTSFAFGSLRGGCAALRRGFGLRLISLREPLWTPPSSLHPQRVTVSASVRSQCRSWVKIRNFS
jgi:hypothetical protein